MSQVLELLGPSTGGIRRHVAALRDGLRAAGWDVATAGPDGVLDGLDGQDFVVPVPDELRPRSILRATLALRRVLDTTEIVHAHGLKAGWIAALATAGRRHRPPVVLTVHNVVLAITSGRSTNMLRRLERRLAARADAVIAVSREIADVLAPSTRVPPVVVPPVGPAARPRHDGSAVRERLGLSPGAPLVVTVARLHPQKGLDVLIEAVPVLRALVPDAVVVVVGDGPERDALRQAAAPLGSAMRFIGARPDASDELAAADVVAVPSRWESGPLVVAEALELGRPVVATPVGFVPDLVEDGVSGRIVPVGDARGFAQALAELLLDPERAAAMAGRGREAARRVLGPEALVARVAEVYEQVRRP